MNPQSPLWSNVLDAALADAALQPFLRDGAAAVAWSLDGTRILAMNDVARRVVGEETGPFGAPAQDRLRQLGQGLAPRVGVRLERLKLGGRTTAGTYTAACRRIKAQDGSEALLTIIRGIGASPSAVTTPPAPAVEAPATPAPEPAPSPPAAVPSAPPAAPPARPLSGSWAYWGGLPNGGLRPTLALQGKAALSGTRGWQLPPRPAPAAPPKPAQEGAAAPVPASPSPAQPAPAARVTRILWESDAEGHLTSLSPPFLALLGEGSAGRLMGRGWSELLQDEVRSEDGTLVAALDSRRTWSGKSALWRTSADAEALRVDLSGVPVHGPQGEFIGYRGFGLIRSETPVPMPARPVTAVPTPEPATHDDAPAVAEATLAQAEAAPEMAGEPLVWEPETPAADEPAPPDVPGFEPAGTSLLAETSDAAPAGPLDDAKVLDAALEAVLEQETPAEAVASTSSEALPPAEPETAEPDTVEPETVESTPAEPAETVAGETDLALGAEPQSETAETAEPEAPASEVEASATDADTPVEEADAAAATPADEPAPQPAEASGTNAVAPGTPAGENAAPEAPARVEAVEPEPPVADQPAPAAQDAATIVADQTAPPVSNETAKEPVEPSAKDLAKDSAEDSAKDAAKDSDRVVRLPVASPVGLRPVLVPAKPALTSAERNAFREIAKALGARLPEGLSEPPAAGSEGMETVAPAGVEPAPAPEAGSEEPAPVPPRFGRVKRTLIEAEDGTLRLPPAREPFAELLDKLPIGVLVNRGDEAVYANRTLFDLLGFDDLDHIRRKGGLAAMFRGPAPHEGGGAVILVGADGQPQAVDARLSAITWQEKPATLMAFRRSVDSDAAAKAKALELDVKARDARLGELSSILDTATDGVVTLDDRGRILSLNRSAEALFGYDQREVVGEPITVLFAPESHLPALDYLEGLKGGGVASVLNDGREVVGRVRQGGRAPLFMTMGRIAEGEERKFCAVLRDITAWKKAEAELTEARKAAENASAQKSDVLAKISHEIRTPLNAIIGFSEVMAEERFGPIGNERYKEYLRDIRESGGYVISLVNDLLDLAKIEAGRLDLEFTSVSLNEIATSAVSLMQPEAARGRVVLRTGLAPKLPPVVADQRSLRQIVLNILSNAVKFTDAGGQVIVSTALGDHGEAILRVRDTGIGMSEKELAMALEPFRQVGPSRRGKGTGLGLPLTKALVEANRGAFSITSVKSEGTLVEVTFPPQRVLAS